MSAMIKLQSKMKNKKMIVAGLTMMGVSKDSVSVGSDNELTVNGYSGQRTGADVVIDKTKYHKGYGDVGFRLEEDGTYSVMVDDMDNVGSLARTAGVTDFRQSAEQYYNAAVVKKALEGQGFIPVVKKEGAKIRVLAQAA